MVVIDEIGYMELKSKRFRLLVEEALNSPRPLLATIMRSRFDFPDKIKARSDVALITVRVENRERLVGEVVGMLLNPPSVT
jgi:nucleoside-triphosphatase